jgi:hypothetical protein
MPYHSDHYLFRDELIQRLVAEVVGPVGGPDETLAEPPTTAYLAGVLYPRAVATDLADVDADVDQHVSEDSAADLGVSMAHTKRPSSVGMTFAVDTTRVSSIRVTISAGRYEAVDADGRPTEPVRADARATDDDGAAIFWRRRQLTPTPIPLDVTRLDSSTAAVEEGLEMRIRVRAADQGGAATVTLTLVNGNRQVPRRLVDAEAFLQVGFRVEADSAAFLDRTALGVRSDREQELGRLLY